MTRILFFKAQKPGLDAVMGDLFDTPSTVSGHMRGSTYVAPYQSTRKKKREEPVSKPQPEPVQLSYRDMNPVNRGQEYRAHYAGAVAKIRKVNTAYVASIYTGTNNSFNGLYSESAQTLKEAKTKIGQAVARLVADGTLTPGAREPHQVVTQPEPGTLTPGDVVRYSDTGVDFGDVIYQGPHEQVPKTLAWVKTQDGRLITARWEGLIRVPVDLENASNNASKGPAMLNHRQANVFDALKQNKRNWRDTLYPMSNLESYDGRTVEALIRRGMVTLEFADHNGVGRTGYRLNDSQTKMG